MTNGGSIIFDGNLVEMSEQIVEPKDEEDKIKQLTRLLRERCSHFSEDETERTMAQIEKFLARVSGPAETTQSFLQETANTISRMFDFAEFVVALKDRSDGLFKYVAFVGMRKEAELAYRKLGYTADEAISPIKFPRIKLTNHIDFFLGEYRPYREGELETFNRPSQLGKERGSMENLQEGDYICVYFFTPTREILGWFEIARTMNGLIPSRHTFKWIEFLAVIAGRIVYEKEFGVPRR